MTITDPTKGFSNEHVFSREYRGRSQYEAKMLWDYFHQNEYYKSFSPAWLRFSGVNNTRFESAISDIKHYLSNDKPTFNKFKRSLTDSAGSAISYDIYQARDIYINRYGQITPTYQEFKEMVGGDCPDESVREVYDRVIRPSIPIGKRLLKFTLMKRYVLIIAFALLFVYLILASASHLLKASAYSNCQYESYKFLGSDGGQSRLDGLMMLCMNTQGYTRVSNTDGASSYTSKLTKWIDG